MTLTVISLGAGVQSTTMALMAAAGEITPMPDCAIFADTGWEPKAVYEHLDWLESVLPFPVFRVTAGNLRTDTIAGTNSDGKKYSPVPWYTVSPRGKLGVGRRQCTREYKLRPIQRKVVELLGGKRPRGGCTMLIGISTDEAIRIKPSRVLYINNQHPLIDACMSRRDAADWLWAHFLRKAPRSACQVCPFRSNEEYRMLAPDEFADAIKIDVAIRHQGRAGRLQFAHPSRRPLSEIDMSTAEERGQGNLFNNECEGMCGV